ncbi:hypothetical protein ACLOJK_014102 [Asimina triloba]
MGTSDTNDLQVDQSCIHRSCDWYDCRKEHGQLFSQLSFLPPSLHDHQGRLHSFAAGLGRAQARLSSLTNPETAVSHDTSYYEEVLFASGTRLFSRCRCRFVRVCPNQLGYPVTRASLRAHSHLLLSISSHFYLAPFMSPSKIN